MEQQINIMLALQDSMNTKVTNDWRAQNYEWYRAIWLESAEMLDHYGWKWWKKQVPDVDQVTLELVDIWHFGLSILLLEEKSAADIGQSMQAALQQKDERTFAEILEDFVANTLATKAFDVSGFCRLMNATDLDFNQLYVSYVGKNVLNFFRQDNGYKDGSYRKTWAGREDNEHLVELAATLDTGALDYKDHLYDALQARYQQTAVK